MEEEEEGYSASSSRSIYCQTTKQSSKVKERFMIISPCLVAHTTPNHPISGCGGQQPHHFSYTAPRPSPTVCWFSPPAHVVAFSHPHQLIISTIPLLLPGGVGAISSSNSVNTQSLSPCFVLFLFSHAEWKLTPSRGFLSSSWQFFWVCCQLVAKNWLMWVVFEAQRI